MPEKNDPSNGEILSALQGMCRRQRDLLKGVEGRVSAKIGAAEERLGDRLAQDIQARPVVVHVDMTRVSELEKQVQELARRVAELETRSSSH